MFKKILLAAAASRVASALAMAKATAMATTTTTTATPLIRSPSRSATSQPWEPKATLGPIEGPLPYPPEAAPLRFS
jgi:hypothetical protein